MRTHTVQRECMAAPRSRVSPRGVPMKCRVRTPNLSGSLLGFQSILDRDCRFRINSLRAKCRVCRVLLRRREFPSLALDAGRCSRGVQRSPRFGLQVDAKTHLERNVSAVSIWGVLVGPPRFELGTSCTPSKRASQAAPRPEVPIVHVIRANPEPLAFPPRRACPLFDA